VHDEPEVGADHLLASFFVAQLDPLRQFHLRVSAEQRILAQIVEE
jgi:hypothetical protein